MNEKVYNWFQGFGSVVNFWPSESPYWFTPPASASEAATRTWFAVGDDLRHAMNENVHRLPPDSAERARSFLSDRPQQFGWSFAPTEPIAHYQPVSFVSYGTGAKHITSTKCVPNAATFSYIGDGVYWTGSKPVLYGNESPVLGKRLGNCL